MQYRAAPWINSSDGKSAWFLQKSHLQAFRLNVNKTEQGLNSQLGSDPWSSVDPTNTSEFLCRSADMKTCLTSFTVTSQPSSEMVLLLMMMLLQILMKFCRLSFRPVDQPWASTVSQSEKVSAVGSCSAGCGGMWWSPDASAALSFSSAAVWLTGRL